MQQFGFCAVFIMAATTLPLSFWIARACLAGVIRLLEQRTGR